MNHQTFVPGHEHFDHSKMIATPTCAQMKLVPVCAALLIFFFLGVNAAEFKKGERAQNHPFDCMLPDGSYKGSALANVNQEWHGSFEDAKKKCAQSPQCKMLHDYAADNGSWRVCRAVKYDPKGEAVTFTKILGVADMDQCQGVDIRVCQCSVRLCCHVPHRK